MKRFWICGYWICQCLIFHLGEGIELCPPEYSLCQSIEEEGICVSRKTCLQVNNLDVCTLKNSCFEQEVVSCYDHTTCQDVLEFNRTEDFCESECTLLLKNFFYGSQPLILESKIQFPNRSWDLADSDRDLSKYHTCLGICNIDGLPNEEGPLRGSEKRELYIECDVESSGRDQVFIKRCSVENRVENRVCKKNVELSLNSYDDFVAMGMDDPFLFEDSLPIERFHKSEDIRATGFDQYWGKWYNRKDERGSNNHNNNNIESQDLIHANKEPAKKTKEDMIQLFPPLERNFSVKTLHQIIFGFQNQSCPPNCTEEKEHKITMDEIIDCELQPSKNDSKEGNSLRGISCRRTNLKCYFQDSNCTDIKKKEDITIYLDEMWKEEKEGTNKSCDTKIKLNIDGYSADKAFWNFTCDELEKRNRTKLPRAYIRACSQKWYDTKFVSYDENICNLDCKEPMFQCNVYWGTICVDSIRECNFLHGNKKEKTMALITGTVPNVEISLKSLNLNLKNVTQIRIDSIYNYSNMFDVEYSNQSGDWSTLREGLVLNTKDLTLRFNFSSREIKVNYITITSNISKKGNELERVQRRLIGFVQGYEFEPISNEVKLVNGSYRVELNATFPKDLYTYWMDHQILLSIIESDLSIGIYSHCNYFLERIKSSHLIVTLLSDLKNDTTLFFVDIYDRYFELKKGYPMVVEPEGFIEAFSNSMQGLSTFNASFSFMIDIDYYSESNITRRNWNATIEYHSVYTWSNETGISICNGSTCMNCTDCGLPGPQLPTNRSFNAAPVVKLIRSPMEFLVPDDDQNEGYLIKDLMEMFYEDPDGDTLGMGILLAQMSGTYGRWQYKAMNESWLDIGMDPGAYKYFISQLTPEVLDYEGPFDITTILYDLMCYKNMNPCNLTVNGCSLVYSVGPEELLGTSRAKSMEMRENRTKDMDNVTLPVLLLEGNVRLRYLPNQKNKKWSMKESFLNANLIFTAWDGTNNKTLGDEILIRQPFCCGECGEGNSLARDYTRIVAKSQDCDGGPIMNSMSKVDECGICGGQNDCKDCKGVVNGGHVIICGKCAMPNEKVIDCNGGCNAHILMNINGLEVCVPKAYKKQKTGFACDGIDISKSKATINECGFCYGGETKLPNNTGMNACGECIDDKRWTSNQTCGIPGVFPFLIDNSILQTFNLFVENDKIKKWTYGICNLTDEKGMIIASSEKIFPEKEKEIMVTYDNVTYQGTLYLKCKLDKNLFDGGKIRIVDSRLIELDKIESKLVDKKAFLYEIIIHLKTPIMKTDASKLACFYRNMFKGELMIGAFLINESTVNCGKYRHNLGKNVIEFGVLFDPTVPIEKQGIETKSITFPKESPIILRGVFNEKTNIVQIKFSMNIEGPNDCTMLFTNKSLKLIDYDPLHSKCEYLGNILRFTLGSNNKIRGGIIINFKSCDIRPLNTEPNDVTNFLGSVMLLSSIKRNLNPDFKLRGRTSFCPNKDISFKVVDMNGMKTGNLICKITDEEGNSVHKDLDEIIVKLDLKLKTTKIKKDKKKEKKSSAKVSTKITQKKLKVSIDHKNLKPGQTYRLEVTGERVYRSRSSIKTDMKTMNFSIMDENSPISLHIKGPKRPIPVNRPLRLKGKLKSCKKKSSFRKEYTDIKYSWTSKPSIPMMKKRKSSNKKLKIKNGLIGGTVYTFVLKIEAKPTNSSLSMFEMSTSFIVETLTLGPKAFVPMDKITFGVENDIVLDGDASLDQDNNNEDLKFEWFCERDTRDKGCFVSDIHQKGIPKLLKQHLSKEAMKRHRLLIPKHTLIPGIYNFTLEVKVERIGNISRRSVLVEVVLGKTGSMEFARLNRIIDVHKPTMIKALIQDATDICLKWECEVEKGYAYIDLKKASKSGELKCFQDIQNEIMFNLVIRPNTLISGAVYKLRLIQKNQQHGTIANATIILSAHQNPRIPIFKISPEEGLAMSTKFNLEFVDLPTEIADDELKFTFKLFYGPDQDEKIYLTNDVFEEFELPASDKHLFVFLQMCDEFEVCETVGSDNSVDIVLNNKFGKDSIKALKENAVKLENEGECLLSMSYLYRIIATLRDEKLLYDAHYQDVCTLFYAIFLDCSNAFSQEITLIREYDSITIAMQLFIASNCFNNKRDETIMRDEKSDGNIGLNVEKRAIQSVNKIKNIILDTTLEDNLKTEVSLTDEKEDGKRQKRETKDPLIPKKKPLLKLLSRSLTNKQMQVLIDWSTNSLKNSDDAKTEFQQFLDQIVFKYMKAICKTTDSQSDVEIINTDDVDMSVLSKDFSVESSHSVDTNIKSLESIKFEDAMIAKLKKWECSDIVTCSGLSIGAIEINSDMVVTDYTSKEAPKIISSVLGLHLLNPYTCEPIVFEKEDYFQMSVEVNQFSEAERLKREKSFQMQCMVLVEGKWDMKSCETEGFSHKDQDSAVVYCKCSKSGYVAIGMVDSDNEVVVIEQSFDFQKDVQFRILDKYEKELDTDNLNIFKTSLLDRLKKTVGIKSSEVKNFAMMKGPAGELMVKFELVSEGEVDSVRLKNSYSELQDLIKAGTFKMKGLNGDPVVVPAQCIGNCVEKKPTAKKKDYMIPIIIGSVVVAFLIFISICILCAVQSKKRRLDDKVKPYPSKTEMTPSYRTLQYANSLQGTVSSMKRIKEDKLKKELKKNIDENVLPPADYETPTPELSHRIKSVSPEMVASLTRHLELPGTPENK